MSLPFFYTYSDGRIGRRAYWKGLVILLLFSLPPIWLRPLAWVVSLVFAWFWVCLISRRMHDFGLAGPWMLLVPLVMLVGYVVAASGGSLLIAAPLVGLPIAFLVGIGLKAGEAGENRFGPPPPA